MGAKCGSLCAGKDKAPVQFRDSLPSDVDDYHPDRVNQKLPKLSFQGNISNVKIINCPENSYFSVKLKIQDIIEIDLPKRKVQPITQIKRQSGQQITFVQNQLKWLSREKLAFLMDEFQLRTHFLNVYIYNSQNQLASNIRVNLYAIVTGPYRYDFYINLNSHESRLLFEVFVSQKVEAKLQPLQIKIQLQKGYFAQEFNFSLKQLNHGQVVSTSKVSNPQKTLPETSSQWSFDRQHSPEKVARSDSPMLKQKKGRYLNIPGDPRKTLKWISSDQNLNHKDSKNHQIQLKMKQSTVLGKKKLPHLKIHILSNQIIKSTIHFNLWVKKQKNMSDLPLKNIQKDSIIFGSIHLNLNKIFDQEFKQMDAKYFISQAQIKQNAPNYKLEMREFQRQDNLISKEGLVLARCLMKFRLTNPKFFKQLNYCVKTQDGIINMTSAFKNYSGKKVYLKNPVIKDIINHSLKIHNLTKKLSIMQATFDNDRKEILKTQEQIYNQFDIINKELINSCSSSYVLSSSNMQLDLLETQDAFIQVLQQLYIFLAQKSWRFKDICWEISLNIYKRGQFFLENLGFKDFQKKQYTNVQALRKKKIAVGLRFKCILYKFLIIALEQFEKQKVLNKTSWKELFKAFACYRVPLFRDTVVKLIYETDSQQVKESKLPEFDEIYTPFSSKFGSEFEKSANHIDWKRYFYAPIDSTQESIKLDNELVSVLQINKWIRVLKMRSTEFFVFVGCTSKVLYDVAKNMSIMKWKYFPGYTMVVRSFLLQMKKQDLLSYPTSMIQTSINLLVNEELINILMTIVLEKTDINSHQLLSKGMNIVWSYLSKVTQDGKKKLPQVFNYLYFYKMLKIVFQSQNSFALGKVLIIVEYFFKSFNEQFKQNLSMYLMGKVFFKLFFNWSYAIRMVFFVILVSKIQYNLIKRLNEIQTTNVIRTKESFLAHHQLQQRYSKIIQLVFSSQKLKKSQQNEQFYNNCFKDLHRKMQKKIASKKSSLQTQNIHKKKDLSSFYIRKSPYQIENLMQIQCDLEGLQKDSFYFFNKSHKKSGKLKTLRVKSYDDTQTEEAVVFHGQSFTLEDAGFQKCLRKFDTQYEKEEQEFPSSSEDRSIKEDHFNFTSDRFNMIGKNPQDQSSPKKFKSMKFQVPQLKSSKIKAKHTYFKAQDYRLMQMTLTEIRQIQVSMRQFRIVKNKIDKFVQQNGRVPEFDFNVELGRDQEFDIDLFKWTKS